MGTGGRGKGGRSRSDRRLAAFFASFLSTAALPANVTRIRAPDLTAAGPAPGAQPGSGIAGARSYGHAIWLGPPDARLYRVDDERWLLASVTLAAKLAAALARSLDVTPASADTSHRPPDLIADGLASGVTRVFHRGMAVARLRLSPGEDATLPADLVAELGHLVADQLELLARTADALRPPPWHPTRWHHPHQLAWIFDHPRPRGPQAAPGERHFPPMNGVASGGTGPQDGTKGSHRCGGDRAASSGETWGGSESYGGAPVWFLGPPVLRGRPAARPHSALDGDGDGDGDGDPGLTFGTAGIEGPEGRPVSTVAHQRRPVSDEASRCRRVW
ncbi:hypothetical protein [Candidatus Frankia nodulisporulans]|nr:hypothetical protein [Candidatus Frankia nodulisporulans]